MVLAVEDEAEQFKGLREGEEVQLGISAIANEKNGEANYFEDKAQEEQNQCNVCSDNSADKSNEDLNQQHRIFSL